MVSRVVNKINVDDLIDIQKAHAAIARRTLKAEQANGFPESGFITLVDNKEGKSLAQVKPYGRIEFIRPAGLERVAIETLDLLHNASPVGAGRQADRTGRYYEKHIPIFNGVRYDNDAALTAAIQASEDPNSDILWIVNFSSYARKIERGLSDQAPKGVYKRVKNFISRKYGKILFVKERYLKAANIPGVSPSLVWKVVGTKGGQPVQVEQVYPAIQLVRGRGTGRVRLN